MDKTIIDLAKNRVYEAESLLAFISVETGGLGFDAKTGKIIIQFEPSWFRKKEPFAPSGAWNVNRVDVQSKEWVAFNNAYSIAATAAMESTSIGLGQIMGFHYKRLGYKTVNEMWDDARKGIKEQFEQILKFIDTDQRLRIALKTNNWNNIATYYNGARYKELAVKIGREPYDISMKKEYDKYKLLLNKI